MGQEVGYGLVGWFCLENFHEVSGNRQSSEALARPGGLPRQLTPRTLPEPSVACWLAAGGLSSLPHGPNPGVLEHPYGVAVTCPD